MTKFKVGDRVKVVRNVIEAKRGDTGTIMEIKDNDDAPYAVEIDQFQGTDKGHNCDGLVPSSNGYWFLADSLELLHTSLPLTITLTYDGKRTFTAVSGDSVATARCNPSDKFVFSKGAHMALQRIIEKGNDNHSLPSLYLEWHNRFLGNVGDKTILKDSDGKPLFIGDTVKLHRRDGEVYEKSAVHDDEDGDYIMGIALAGENYAKRGFTVKKFRDFSTFKAGDTVDNIEYKATK